MAQMGLYNVRGPSQEGGENTVTINIALVFSLTNRYKDSSPEIVN